MEKVIFATFDPTVFTARCISEMDSFRTLKFSLACEVYNKLAEAHKKLKVPIHVVTAATLRNWKRKNTFPRKDSIYYDPYTGMSCTGTCKDPPQEFYKILATLEIPNDFTLRFFKRANNIAKHRFGTPPPEDEEEEEEAVTYNFPLHPCGAVQDLHVTDTSEDEALAAASFEISADEQNSLAIAKAFQRVMQMCIDEKDLPYCAPPPPVDTRYTIGWPRWSVRLHKWLPEPTAEQKELYSYLKAHEE